MGRVKIKSVVEADPKSNNVGPIMVRFEHAAINPEMAGLLDLNQIFGTAVFQNDTNATGRDFSHLSTSAAFESTSKMSKKESRGTKRKQVVALQSDEMTYIGTKGFDNPNLISSSDDMMRTFVALKDKKRLRLFEVTPITVSPYLKGLSHVVEMSRDTTEERSKEERTDLIKAFGSKKKRIAYERLEKHKINTNDMQASIDAAVGGLEVPEGEPVMKDDSITTLVPPCNRNAAYAVDVYRLEHIISEDELGCMEDLVINLLGTAATEVQQWKEKRLYSDYFFEMWAKLQKGKNDPRTLQKAKTVFFTELIIIFLKLGHNQIRNKKRVDLPDVFPLWMKEKVLDNFSVLNATGIRNRPEALKDKACCYVMVLVLLANDLIFDVQLMSTSLNIHINKLLTLAKAVGITIKRNVGSKSYQGWLKLPLPKIVERRGSRKPLR